jgi:hypothetical protein
MTLLLLALLAAGPSSGEVRPAKDWLREGVALDHLQPVRDETHGEPNQLARRALASGRAAHAQMMKFPPFSGPWVVFVSRDETLTFRRVVSRSSEPLRIETSTAILSPDTLEALDDLWDAALADPGGPVPEDEFVLCMDGNVFEFTNPASFGPLVAATTNCKLPVRMQALANIGRRMADLTLAPLAQRKELEEKLRETAVELRAHFPGAGS